MVSPSASIIVMSAHPLNRRSFGGREHRLSTALTRSRGLLVLHIMLILVHQGGRGWERRGGLAPDTTITFLEGVARLWEGKW